MTIILTAGDALYAEILSNPADDGIRLIYADWLEDNGWPDLATFIRLQFTLLYWGTEPRAYGNWYVDCRNSRNGTDEKCDAPKSGGLWVPCEYHELRLKERHLLRENGPVDLFMPATVRRYFSTPEGQGFWIGESCFHVVFKRGFISEITCTQEDWLAHGAALVKRHPVQVVRLSDVAPHSEDDYPRPAWRKPLPVESEVNVMLPELLAATIHPDVWERLTGDICPNEKNYKEYDTADEAVADLFAACLAQARGKNP